MAINPPKEVKSRTVILEKNTHMGKGKVSLSLEVRNKGVGKSTLKERDLKM